VSAEHDQEPDAEGAKPVRPNLLGVVTGVFALIVLAITHFTIGFPDMFIHVLMLPVIIGLVVRWSIKLNYTNAYRDD
jgi:hypothetical protein